MAFIYPDNPEPFTGRPMPYSSIPATSIWKKHCENYYLLKWIHDHTGDAREKCQAQKEMSVAERKMKYMEKHPNYTRTECEGFLAKLRRNGLG
jgi:hypothetical protein